MPIMRVTIVYMAMDSSRWSSPIVFHRIAFIVIVFIAIASLASLSCLDSLITIV